MAPLSLSITEVNLYHSKGTGPRTMDSERHNQGFGRVVVFQGRTIERALVMHSGKRDLCRAPIGTMHWRPDGGHDRYGRRQESSHSIGILSQR